MDAQSDLNPYQSPGNEAINPAHANQDLRETRRIKLAWVGVFLLNLCMPVFFGSLVTERGGRSGMFAGVALLFVIGYRLCTSAQRIGRTLVVGGVAVGLMQVFPAVQMMAGIVGFCAVSTLQLEGPDPDDVMLRVRSDSSGFVLTIVTGGLLMAAAFVAGLLVCGLFAAAQRRRSGA